MLEVGNGGLSDVDARSHFSMWAIVKSPLILGPCRQLPQLIRKGTTSLNSARRRSRSSPIAISSCASLAVPRSRARLSIRTRSDDQRRGSSVRPIRMSSAVVRAPPTLTLQAAMVVRTTLGRTMGRRRAQRGRGRQVSQHLSLRPHRHLRRAWPCRPLQLSVQTDVVFRDLWQDRKSVGVFSGEFTTDVVAHGTRVFEIERA